LVLAATTRGCANGTVVRDSGSTGRQSAGFSLLDDRQRKEDLMHIDHRSTVADAATPRSRLLASAAALLLLAGLAVLLQPASGNAAQTRAQATGPLVSTGTTSLGRILVNSSGRTLYLFEKDKSGKSACTGQCATFWPPLIAAGKPRAGAGVKASLLGETKRADGRMQVTYNHHPLYFFARDTKKGQTTGENVNAFGADWYAVSSAGTIVEPKTSSTPAPSSGGSGY
jgi:predicted lipoprotein with Yx(FWY)xxD motif